MTKRTRTLLFFSLVLLFSVVAPALILYSLGYRVDWQEGSIAQTGGLYIKTDPANAVISINGKQEKKTDFLFGELFVDNLLPGTYAVKIEKEGYKPWQKNLVVQAKQVTEAKNIMLFPAQTALKTLFDSVEEVWPSPDLNLLLLQQTSPQRERHLLLWNPRTNKETPVIQRLTFTQKIQSVQWDKNGKAFLVQFQKGGGQPLVFNEQGEPCKESFCLENILKIQPTDQEKFLSAAEESLRQIFPQIQERALSPDEKKIALTQGSELWLLYLQDDEGQPKRTKGERVFLSRFGEQIQNLSWVSNHYLLLGIGGDVRIVEIDDRDSLNTISLGSFPALPASPVGGPNLRIFWDNKEKVIYILGNGILSVSEKLLR
ncbi:MAG: PEGA domain-containing protein [Parcubacteria group bacterium]|nr:PEGA domain-containing protein [Parcubacteria group bacterium]